MYNYMYNYMYVHMNIRVTSVIQSVLAPVQNVLLVPQTHISSLIDVRMPQSGCAADIGWLHVQAI